MVKDKFLLTAVVSVGTLHSGDRHQARFHGQHLGLCRLILVGHGDDFTGSIFLHGHHGTSLNIRGIARRDDLRRTALIGGCDLHSREIQQLTRGIDPLVRLLRHSDGLHRIRYRLDRDRRAEVTRRNSDGVLARLPVSNTDGKVRHILGLASLVDALDRQPSLQLLQRGGVIELCIRLRAGRQVRLAIDGDGLFITHAKVQRVCDAICKLIICICRVKLKGRFRRPQILRNLKCDLSKFRALSRSDRHSARRSAGYGDHAGNGNTSDKV